MPLNLVLELSDEDLSYFARVMDSVWKKNAKRPDVEGVPEFCQCRDNEAPLRGKKPGLKDWLAARCRQIVDPIERRCDRLFGRKGRDGCTHPILRYKY